MHKNKKCCRTDPTKYTVVTQPVNNEPVNEPKIAAVTRSGI